MAYQFIHIENYGLTKPKKAKTNKPTVDEVLNEASRKEGYTPHIAKPKPPVVLHGSIEEVRKAVDEYVQGTRDAKGRKLRVDANVLLAGVVSLPRDMAEDWPAYRAKTVDWLKQKYGKSLKCIVEHTDETHPHLHFYAVQEPGKPFDLHPGIAAFKKTHKKLSMIQAMRDFQEEFYDNVTKDFGIPRLGPRKQRLTRAQWKAQQAQFAKIRKIEEYVKQEVERKTEEIIQKIEEQKIQEIEGGIIGKIKLSLKALHTPTIEAIEKIKKEYNKKIRDLNKIIQNKDKTIKEKDDEIKNLKERLEQTNNFHSAALTRATNAERQVKKLNEIIDEQKGKIGFLENLLKRFGIKWTEPQLNPQSHGRTKGIEL